MFETTFTVRDETGRRVGQVQRFLVSARELAQREGTERGAVLYVYGETVRRLLFTVRPDGTFDRH